MRRKTVSQIWCHFKPSVFLIFNVAYDWVMLKNNIFVLGVQKHIAHWRKKKINHFRNKSIPIEENCQYFPELSYTLVLLLYILSYVLILIGTTQFMLKYNYNVWLFFLIERCILPWNHFSFRTIHEIKNKEKQKL